MTPAISRRSQKQSSRKPRPSSIFIRKRRSAPDYQFLKAKINETPENLRGSFCQFILLRGGLIFPLGNGAIDRTPHLPGRSKPGNYLQPGSILQRRKPLLAAPIQAQELGRGPLQGRSHCFRDNQKPRPGSAEYYSGKIILRGFSRVL